MTVVGVLLAISVAQAPYVRSRVDTDVANDPNAHCLWWREAKQGPRVISYQQSALGNPETTGETEFLAVTRSFESWQRMFDGCGNLTFQEGPRSPERKVGYVLDAPDNKNLVVFRTRLCTDLVGPSDGCWRNDDCMNQYDCWAYAPGTIALTTTTYERTTGEVYDADVEFNAHSFIFTTVDAPPCISPNFGQFCVATDVQNTMTHEIGHMLGLDHTGRTGSTMQPSAPAGETSKRTVDPGSASFVCDVYPKGQPTRDCVVNPIDQNLGNAAGGCSGLLSSQAAGVLLLGLVVPGLIRRGAHRP